MLYATLCLTISKLLLLLLSLHYVIIIVVLICCHVLQANNISLPVTPKAPWSMDANLMHISFESGILEDPALIPPPGIFQMTVDPEKAAETKDQIVISFEQGMVITTSVSNE